MLEAQSHAPQRRLRLVTEDDALSDGEITQVTGPDERPDDTIIQGRDRVSGIMRKNPDSESLQEAFDYIESMALNKLPDSYNVMGDRLAEGSGGVYKLSIKGVAAHNYGSFTTVTISRAADGSPHWEIQGEKLDLAFERDLVILIEDTIAKVRRR